MVRGGVMNKVICVIGATIGAVIGAPLILAAFTGVMLGLFFGIGWVELWLLPIEQFNSAPVFWGCTTFLVLAVSCIVYAVGVELYNKCQDYWGVPR
jgi:hypothetical protein